MARRSIGVGILLGLLAAAPARAEILEEIVAKVNDEIITMSEIEREEQAVIAELYREFTGEALDAKVIEARGYLLQSMIDRKLLIHRAERLYDIAKMQEVLLDNFMDQEGISSLDELEDILAQQGLTIEALARRLVEMAAPTEVIRFEVEGRLSVGEKEIRGYYDEHPEEFEIAGEVMLREIVFIARGEDQAKRRQEAEEVHARLLEQDADFAEIATEASDASSSTQGGQIGPFRRGDLMSSIEEPAFTLPVGVISEILVSDNGLHIIRVESRTQDRIQPYEEIEEELSARIEDEKYAKALNEFLERAREEANIWVAPQYAAKYGVQASTD